jgi:hypothetical protein
MSAGDVRDLHAGGVHPEMRPTHPSSSSYATNGAHAPPAPTPVPREPENSVIIDRSVSADASGHIAPPSFAPPQQATIPSAIPPSARRQAVPALTPPVAQVRAAAVDFGVDEFPRKSKKGLWAGVGVAALAAVGIVIWASSGGKETPAAAPVPTVQKPVEDKVSAIPPPPPETAVSPPPTPPPQVTVAAVTAAPPAPLPPPVVTPAALPPAAPAPVTHAGTGGGTKTPHEPKPASHGKAGGGQTIVRDVPF